MTAGQSTAPCIKLRPFVAALPVVYLEVLEVNLLDALAEDANPLLRIAVQHHVAGIEVASDVRAADRIQHFAELERAKQQLVPDVLQTDVHSMPLGVEPQVIESAEQAVVRDIVGDVSFTRPPVIRIVSMPSACAASSIFLA